MAFRSCSRFSLEELAVDKVYRAEKNNADDFDELYNDVRQQKIDERESEQKTNDDVTGSDDTESTLESEEAPVDSVSEDQDPIDDGNDQKEPDSKESLESFMSIHAMSSETFIATEDIFTKENLLTAGKAVGESAVDGLVWLKNIGWEYGPVILKHVYKGILIALNATLKAVFKGSVAIAKYIKKRIYSYQNFKSKIEKARETLALLEDKDIGNVFFTNESVIQQLVIGNSLDVQKNASVGIRFFNDFFSIFSSKVQNHILGVKRIVDGIIRTNGQYVNQYEPTIDVFPNFNKGELNGYKPESENVDSYLYNQLLPGNIRFIGFLPKHNLQTVDSKQEALDQSKMFLGSEVASIKYIKSIPFKSKRELSKFIDTLEMLCDLGLSTDKTFTDVIQRRNGLKSILQRYTRFLFELQDKISIHDSMAVLISSELKQLDATFIAGSLQIHDYNTRLISAGLEYVKKNIEVLS